MSEHHNPNESTTVNNLDVRGNIVGDLSSGVNSVAAKDTGDSPLTLTTDLVQLVTSGNASHVVKLPASTKAGQIIIVVSIGSDDVKVQDRTTSNTDVVTVQKQSSAILVSTGASDTGAKWNTA